MIKPRNTNKLSTLMWAMRQFNQNWADGRPNFHLATLPLPIMTWARLRDAGINTTADLEREGWLNVMMLYNFGVKALTFLRDVLYGVGVQWGIGVDFKVEYLRHQAAKSERLQAARVARQCE